MANIKLTDGVEPLAEALRHLRTANDEMSFVIAAMKTHPRGNLNWAAPLTSVVQTHSKAIERLIAAIMLDRIKAGIK